jgi:hypothetical protein
MLRTNGWSIVSVNTSGSLIALLAMKMVCFIDHTDIPADRNIHVKER